MMRGEIPRTTTIDDLLLLHCLHILRVRLHYLLKRAFSLTNRRLQCYGLGPQLSHLPQVYGFQTATFEPQQVALSTCSCRTHSCTRSYPSNHSYPHPTAQPRNHPTTLDHRTVYTILGQQRNGHMVAGPSYLDSFPSQLAHVDSQ
jgi:hypothetical protein